MNEYLQIHNNGEITIPPAICRAANLKEGDLLDAAVGGGRLNSSDYQKRGSSETDGTVSIEGYQLGIKSEAGSQKVSRILSAACATQMHSSSEICSNLKVTAVKRTMAPGFHQSYPGS
jgi:hypothetical protein